MAQFLQTQDKDDRYAHCLIPTSEKERIVLDAIRELGNNATSENIGKLIMLRYGSPTLADSARQRMEHMRKWGTIQFHKHRWQIGPNATMLLPQSTNEEDSLHGLTGVRLGTIPQELTERFCYACNQSIGQFAAAEVVVREGRLYICHSETCYDQLYKKINKRFRKPRSEVARKPKKKAKSTSSYM